MKKNEIVEHVINNTTISRLTSVVQAVDFHFFSLLYFY